DLVDTPHGRALILELDDAAAEPLVGAEVAIAAALGPVRKREFVAGRTALRSLLGEPVAIVPDERGAPMLPAGWVGSISHKHDRAAALVAPAGDGFVGVDIEIAGPPRMPIEKRILTAREQHRIRDGRDVTLHFAIKEAIYKAIDPMVRRYVGFTEVELEIAADGSCSVHAVDAARLPVTIEAWWREHDGHWLATARGRKR
ncbi:MAG TPA: 4'-phosphopantetheinyl transferase superfamily protein, partial [Kofleriaceae bacterium]|nr:4'-phosphopantetheinyl transferase superfamily protein [Kofleriaceae bacterium]